MREVQLFLTCTDAEGAQIDSLHLGTSVDAYHINDDDGTWTARWFQNYDVSKCATEVVHRLESLSTWREDEYPVGSVDMELTIVLTNTETCKFKRIYAEKVDDINSNMNEEQNTYYFNFPMMGLPGDNDEDALAPYFAIDFNDPSNSEVGVQAMMSAQHWKACTTKLVGK
jgi:hypothetical protein